MSLSSHSVSIRIWAYTYAVPKLWTQTVEAHRHEVRHAIMDTAAGLVAEQGLRSVTMSEIAQKTGIGRATLYKYFPDVEAILFAWHERQIAGHLEHLAEVQRHAEGPGQRLRAVLGTYALHAYESRQHHQSELASLVHEGEHVTHARQQLDSFIRDLISAAADAGDIRTDISPTELTTYCIHSLDAAHSLPTRAAVNRLVDLTLDALRPPN